MSYERFHWDDDVLLTHDCLTEKTLKNYLSQHPTPRYIVGDQATRCWFDGIKVYTLPLFLNHTVKCFQGRQFKNYEHTKYCFNFMSNRKTIHRYLLMRLVQYHNLDKFTYTWSGIGENVDDTLILQDIERINLENPKYAKVHDQLLGPVTLTKKFTNSPDAKSTGHQVENYGSNVWTWETFLQEMFHSSGVSLISESSEFEKASGFTEKTVFSVLGLTFPIWIGAFNSPNEWERLGFDVFHDIIDHSYQTEEIPTLRCIRAFEDNMRLLTDLDYVHRLREKYMDRLVKNRQMLLSGKIDYFIEKELESWPRDLLEVFRENPWYAQVFKT